jgi:hypothetical protein
VRTLLRLFPRRFRERYGDEIADLMRHSDRPARDVADLLTTALSLRIRGAFGVLAVAAGAGVVVTGCAIVAAALAIGGISSAGAALGWRTARA